MRFTFWHPRQGGGDGGTACGIVAAIQPKFHPRRAIDQRAVAQALHAGGPIGLCHGSLGIAHTKVAQRHDRGTCVFDLVRAGQVGQGQVQQAVIILKDQATAIFKCVPVLAVHQ